MRILSLLMLFVSTNVFCQLGVDSILKKGNELQAQGRVNEAINIYNNAIKQDSRNPEVYYYRGNAYFDLKNYKSAIADFNECIKLNPKHLSAIYNRGLPQTFYWH